MNAAAAKLGIIWKIKTSCICPREKDGGLSDPLCVMLTLWNCNLLTARVDVIELETPAARIIGMLEEGCVAPGRYDIQAVLDFGLALLSFDRASSRQFKQPLVVYHEQPEPKIMLFAVQHMAVHGEASCLVTLCRLLASRQTV